MRAWLHCANVIARLFLLLSLVLLVGALPDSAIAGIDAQEIAELAEATPELDEVVVPDFAESTIDVGTAHDPITDHSLPTAVDLPSLFRPPRPAFV
jgi:hypothetical protein